MEQFSRIALWTPSGEVVMQRREKLAFFGAEAWYNIG
jgi:hypothetical protein